MSTSGSVVEPKAFERLRVHLARAREQAMQTSERVSLFIDKMMGSEPVTPTAKEPASIELPYLEDTHCLIERIERCLANINRQLDRLGE